MQMTVTATGDLTYTIGGTAVNTAAGSLSGELGGVTDVVNQILKAHKTTLDTLASTLVNTINTANAAGKDQAGNAGGILMSFGVAGDPAGTIQVDPTVVANPRLIAASGNVGPGPIPPPIGQPDLDGSNADKMSLTTSITANYGALVTAFGAQVAAINSQRLTQATMTSQVTDEQQQLVGVNLDEETVSLVAAQHAYEAASKVMQTLDSILDTLINMKR
jgi:flagellar hook-associated protein 1 FlgK